MKIEGIKVSDTFKMTKGLVLIVSVEDNDINPDRLEDLLGNTLDYQSKNYMIVGVSNQIIRGHIDLIVKRNDRNKTSNK